MKLLSLVKVAWVLGPLFSTVGRVAAEDESLSFLLPPKDYHEGGESDSNHHQQHHDDYDHRNLLYKFCMMDPDVCRRHESCNGVICACDRDKGGKICPTVSNPIKCRNICKFQVRQYERQVTPSIGCCANNVVMIHVVGYAEKHCGDCDVTCAAGETCCMGNCIDEDTDDNNCGQCGNVCESTETCVDGDCECKSGFVEVNGVCQCPGSFVEVNGSCQCPDGYIECNEVCQPDTTHESCGGQCMEIASKFRASLGGRVAIPLLVAPKVILQQWLTLLLSL